ncbi:MAG: phosphoenolpyruvate--protein phosphotransferase, partial [Victivallales bacterium]|nr:phosphoenolpyruvate--protein phosphotransferase [Victivallales bacterium]
YINRVSPPSVEEQYDTYRGILNKLDGKPLIIRTFDIGGDKLGAMFENTHVDANPFLGCRAIRLRMDYPYLLYDQIRAILMASAHGDIKVMFPMIACMDEVGHLNGLVDNVKRELSKDGIAFNDNLEVGIMIETPAAAMIAGDLAKKVDFFSIGTNDLVQYALAVDRSNEKVAYLYQPAHPAILKLIKITVDAAKENGIWVGVCGEMAGDPRYTPLLVGMGVHELSMSPSSIGQIRRLIRKLYIHDAEKLLEKALQASTDDEVLDITENLLYELAPDIMNMVMSGE